jgi:hypothetical protein
MSVAARSFTLQRQVWLVAIIVFVNNSSDNTTSKAVKQKDDLNK